MRWTLRLTGPPHLCRSDDAAQTLALSRKDAGWLAYVALNAGASSPLVAGLLWPEADARAALNSLRQRVHRLRKASGARLVHMAARIELADDLALDEPDLGALLSRQPDADPGVLLAGHQFDAESEFAAWLAARRQQQLQALTEVHAALADAAETAGEWERALRHARRLLEADRHSEHHHRRLMRLHYLRGDTAAAVAAFEAGERALKDELGVRPSVETLALLRTVEAGQAAAAGMRALAPLPASLSRPPRLVGREAALAELALAAQQAQVAVVVGEAGMGKTRLVQAFLAGAGDGACHVAARPGDGAVPFALLGRLFPRLQDGDAATVTSATGAPRQRVLVESVLRRAAGQGLQTLAIDDLHFADAASVELLLDAALGGAVPALRWIVAHRPEAAGELPPLQALAQSPQARYVALEPWNQPQLESFVASLEIAAFDAPALGATLAQRTGGNPLFVIETLRATLAVPPPAGGARPLARPVGLAHLIDARLRRLSPAALALARVAAVAAPDFDLAVAEGVLGASAIVLADAWHELEAAQVLRGEAFAHDLVHDALLRATPQVIAARLHRQVAALLTGRGVAPARLAQHWLAGDQPAQAARAFACAAEQAAAAGRPREQAELLARCAAAHRAAGDDAAALRAGIERVDPLLQDSGTVAALAAADEAVEACRGSPLLAHALVARALAFGWDGRVAAAAEAAQQALDAAAPGGDDVRVTATAMLANACAMRGDATAALALLLPWQARMDGVGDPRVRREYFGNLTNLLMQASRNGQALAAARRHLDCARQTDHGGEQVAALMNLSNLHGRRGDLELAIEYGQAADRLIPDTEQAALLGPWNRATLGYWLAGAGRFDAALQLLDAAVAALARGNPMQHQMAQGLLARVWVTLGQPARALALVREMPEAPPGRLRASQLALRARIEQARGRDAAPLFRAVVATALSEADFVRLGAEVALADCAGDARALASLQQRAEQLEYFPIAAEAASLRLQAQGEPADVPTVLAAEQRVLAARLPAYYLPEQLARCSSAYRRLGRESDACRCEQAALDWVHKTALPQVPPPFVDSFLHRNPVNAALRAATTCWRRS